MAQAENRGLARGIQAIDERWWLRHGLFWLVRTLLMAWLIMYVIHVSVSLRLALRDMLLQLVVLVPATYALLYGVLPALDRGPRWRAGLLLAGWAFLSQGVNYTFRHLVTVPLYQGVQTPIPDHHNVFAPGPYIPMVITTGVAACLHLYRQWRRKELANVWLAQENYRAELQLLKAQIHPHFLFNTLNNLYALTLRQSAQAPEVVGRLLGLLQFVVEQGTAPLVTLPDEVALLRNYLALEQLRYGPRLTLEFTADDLPAGGRIAPLLLLPLVENAFKHGAAEQVGPVRIGVALAVQGHDLRCVITNSKNNEEPARPATAGIGLRNVRQRLERLYPQRHRLAIEAGPDTYTVRLTLQLPDSAAEPAGPAAPALAAEETPAAALRPAHS
ncbi:hypothetical protein GCM10028824_43020 [Hymenobacter segetis]|uniref:Histidine kinase n=1 Tax=Hymenobacter segetis TaxID=2025509 RepID=A0ABU9LZ08_9BACT